MCSKDPRFIVFRSASEIGVNVFFREGHELLLLSEEIGIHRYVQYTQGRGGWWCLYKGVATRRI